VIADMCERILSSIGHRVSKYTDSVKAVEAFRADPYAYDLIITDVTMPGLTGFDLADEVRAVRGDIPIILCTGYSESLDTRAIAELNIQKCVWKPLDYQDLARAVQEVLVAPRVTEV
jgi:CheY-like chemotaxis protein